MNATYSTQRVSAADFAYAYHLDSDAATLAHVVDSMTALRPIHRHQRCTDQQAWLDDYARIVHESSMLTREDGVVWTTDAAAFAAWAAE